MSDTVKPSQPEEDWFAKEEAEKKRKLAHRVRQDMAVDDAKRLRDLHHGHAPAAASRCTR